MRTFKTLCPLLTIGVLLFLPGTLTADTNPPVITLSSPADDGRGVSPWARLVATFDEPITLTGSGTITITDLSDGSSSQVITLPDARVTSPNGDDLSIDPGAELDLFSHYSVRISAGAVEDQAVTPNGFAGISDDTTWDFTTLKEVHNVLIATAELSDAPPSATAAEIEQTVFTGPVNVDDALRVASYNQMGLRLGDDSAMDPIVELVFPSLVAALTAAGLVETSPPPLSFRRRWSHP